MSARRQARVRGASNAVEASSGVPAVLRLGNLIDIWVDPSRAGDEWMRRAASARTRFSLVRHWWLESVGVDFRSAEAAELLPTWSAWGLEDLSFTGRLVDERAVERFAEVGVSRADLPELRTEAQSLYKRAHRAEMQRRASRTQPLTRGTTND